MLGLDTALALFVVAAIICSVAVFGCIQVYLHHPRRRELNEAWFAEFEAYIRERYRDRELAERVHALEDNFAHIRQQ